MAIAAQRASCACAPPWSYFGTIQSEDDSIPKEQLWVNPQVRFL
ncbi:MAG: hypothetical protein OES18_03070 [Deltaproteobacteria bacterium]|nr:hypothetical protein [Deltaproteobacteria bacterium]